jgi:hypothetical protein
MKQNFIEFRKESVQLANVYASASGCNLDAEDIAKGTLVIGTYDEGNYLAMGWLRGMTRDKQTGVILYEIVNAVEEGVAQFIKGARRVSSSSVPVFAASYDGATTPFVGRPYTCNGENATLCTDDCTEVVSTEFIYRLEPLFKETN